jgi:hypothetical protein
VASPFKPLSLGDDNSPLELWCLFTTLRDFAVRVLSDSEQDHGIFISALAVLPVSFLAIGSGIVLVKFKYLLFTLLSNLLMLLLSVCISLFKSFEQQGCGSSITSIFESKGKLAALSISVLDIESESASPEGPGSKSISRKSISGLELFSKMKTKLHQH